MRTFSYFAPLAAMLMIMLAACGGTSASGTDGGSITVDGGPEGDATLDSGQPLDAPASDAACASPDVDGDGHTASACGGDDCDDEDASRFPGNVENCDGDDEDCDSTTFGVRDVDGDGHVDSACCNSTATSMICGDDCDDSLSGVHREAPEVCNGRDDNCDLAIDEGVLMTYRADCDFDGYGGAESLTQCVVPATAPTTCPGAPWIGVGGDCNDSRPESHPSALETCNLIDDDCNGMPDDGADAWCATSLPHVGDGTCTAGACTFTSCAAPYLDCSVAAGCDIDGSTDPDNCGACGTGCDFGCRASLCDDPVEVQGGGTHTCARRESGTIVCWGANIWGQLGDGTTTSQSRPIPVPGITDAVEMSLGADHTCVRRAGGTVMCWGSNERGQIGDGAVGGASRLVGVAVTGLTDAAEIAAGDIRTCARHTSGAVSCWGAGGPALGDGTTLDRGTPGPVSGLTNAIKLAVGRTHACAVRATGAVACWGVNSSGQLGNGTMTDSSVPVAVTGITTAIDIIAGESFTCALLSSGGVRCWGLNTRHQLGDGTATMRTTPVVAGVSNVMEIATAPRAYSQGHVCALMADGSVKCWGGNGFGQVGNGATSFFTDPSSPILLLADHVAVGGVHSCAIQSGGVYCWGSNGLGRLGDGTTDDRLRATRVLAP